MALVECPKEDCDNWFEPIKKNGYTPKYCSISCANSRTFSAETNELKSRRQKEWWAGLSEDERQQNIKEFLDRIKGTPGFNDWNSRKGSIEWNKLRKQLRLDRIFNNLIETLSHEDRRFRVLMEQDNKCNRCGHNEWLNEPLVLELEHKDGNNQNNVRTNLEALCPNCHSLTPTWRGRNKNTGKKRIRDIDLLRALILNVNIRQALLSLGLAAKGANYNRAKKILKEYGPRG